jgi:hypothetical protein
LDQSLRDGKLKYRLTAVVAVVYELSVDGSAGPVARPLRHLQVSSTRRVSIVVAPAAM